MSGIGAIVVDPGTYATLSPEQADAANSGPLALISGNEHRGEGYIGTFGTTAAGLTEIHGYAGNVEERASQEARAAIAHAKWLSALIQVHNATSPDEQGLHPPYIYGSVAIAFSGTLTRTDELKRRLEGYKIAAESLSGPELLARALGHLVFQGMSLSDAIKETYADTQGAFSYAAVNTKAEKPTIFGVRDPNGVRPLVIGRTAHGYAIASETKGLQTIGAEYERDVRPGEMVELNGRVVSTQLVKGRERMDGFEAIYFAAPDSEMWGTKVSEIRKAFGRQLAIEYRQRLESESIEVNKEMVVVAPPMTAIPYADGFVEELGLTYARNIILKNSEAGRSSLQSTQEDRDAARAQKYSIDNDYLQEITGKDVMLVDDSLIGSGTAKDLVAMLTAAGARTVTVMIGSPPVRYPNYSGMDARKQDKLAAANMTLEEMRNNIECERLGFLSVCGIREAIRKATGQTSRLDLSFSTRRYSYPLSDEQRSSLKRPKRMPRRSRISNAR